jgi:hypothetical protein
LNPQKAKRNKNTTTNNVRYEKPYDAGQSLNILVDGVADGAGEAAGRCPKSPFNWFFHAFGLNSADMALTICSLYSLFR